MRIRGRWVRVEGVRARGADRVVKATAAGRQMSLASAGRVRVDNANAAAAKSMGTTVRALHQTVVGLRTALETCKQRGQRLSSENRQLREKLGPAPGPPAMEGNDGDEEEVERGDDDLLGESEDEEEEEVDDIELIFTTEGSGSVPPQEPLESITEDGGPAPRYRPLAHRDALRPAPRVPLRSAAAQTDVSALKWRSEGFLNRQRLLLPSKPSKPLSNLGFTAMVPELSRSVDHDLARPPPPQNHHQVVGSRPHLESRWPCDCLAASAHHWDSLRSPWCGDKEKRRFSWRTAQSSAETNRGTLTRNSAVWGSVPASPDVPPPGPYVEWAEDGCCCCRRRVFFSSPSLAPTAPQWAGRGSLPDLRAAPEPPPELRPSLSSRPFLPRQPRDLKEDCLAKVIGPEGRVLVGRVRFVGSASAAGFKEPVVGLEVAEHGDSDGSVNGHRLFSCEQGRGLFVPFRKVVLAWHC